MPTPWRKKIRRWIPIKIGFVFPSSEYLFDPFRGDPHTHFQILTVLESALPGLELALIDLRGVKREFALYHVPECDAYLHSVYTLDFNEQDSLVSQLKDRYPRAKHIAGGPHAVEFPDECLKIFDSLILGDGEELIVEALRDLAASDLKPVYKQREPVDLNRYPFPKRHYLPASTVARKGLVALKDDGKYKDLMSTTAIFSRGCPYKCSFCHMPKTKEFGLGIRFKHPELVEAEIEYLKRDYGIQAISFLDEICLPLARAKSIPYLEAIGRTGVAWKGQCRADTITSETARLARQAGCVVMCMGVESASQVPLDAINKKINLAQTKQSIRWLKQSGIEVRLYMILGLPGEPEDIVDRTWSFIRETDPDLVYLSLLTVRPGTEMFNHPEKFGLKEVSKDWDKTMHLFNRYSDERPTLTFSYDESSPLGKGRSPERIVNDYLELQRRLKENGLCTR